MKKLPLEGMKKIKEVLDVLDDFDRAEKALGDTANPSVDEVRDGYRLIEHKLFSILEKKACLDISESCT